MGSASSAPRCSAQTGRIPEWNPYLFGGLPYIAAQHGDIFYPTAWLRWILPIDTAMNLGFALHFVLAGAAMYALLRALADRVERRAGRRPGLRAHGHPGVADEARTRRQALRLRPGAARVPRAAPQPIRDRRPWGYGLLALVIGLCMLSPHYQMTYYLLVAAGLWTLYLVFLDPDRPAGIRWPVALGSALAAVLLGVAISAIQVLPFLYYIPFSPRGEGGPSGGWEYATAFSLPPEEIVTTVLPEFNGDARALLGPQLLQAAHRVPRRHCRGPRRPRRGRPRAPAGW